MDKLAARDFEFLRQRTGQGRRFPGGAVGHTGHAMRGRTGRAGAGGHRGHGEVDRRADRGDGLARRRGEPGVPAGDGRTRPECRFDPATEGRIVPVEPVCTGTGGARSDSAWATSISSSSRAAVQAAIHAELSSCECDAPRELLVEETAYTRVVAPGDVRDGSIRAPGPAHAVEPVVTARLAALSAAASPRVAQRLDQRCGRSRCGPRPG